MVSINDIQVIRAAAAYCLDGNKVGRVGDVYVDDLTNEPAWVTITAGLFGTKTLFAPLAGARLDGDRLMLGYSRDVIAGAPAIADSGHISDIEQQALIDYFTANQPGVPNQPVDAVVGEASVDAAEAVAVPDAPAFDLSAHLREGLDQAAGALTGAGDAPAEVVDAPAEVRAVDAPVDVVAADAEVPAATATWASAEPGSGMWDAAESTEATVIDTVEPLAVEPVVEAEPVVTEPVVEAEPILAEPVVVTEPAVESDPVATWASAESGSGMWDAAESTEATVIDAVEPIVAEPVAPPSGWGFEPPAVAEAAAPVAAATVAAGAAAGVASSWWSTHDSASVDPDVELTADEAADAEAENAAEAAAAAEAAGAAEAEAVAPGEQEWVSEGGTNEAAAAAETPVDVADETAVDAEAVDEFHTPAAGVAVAPAEGDRTAQDALSGQFRMHPGHSRETIYRDAAGNILYSVIHRFEELFGGRNN